MTVLPVTHPYRKNWAPQLTGPVGPWDIQIAESDAPGVKYVSSPSVVKLSGGRLVVSHDHHPGAYREYIGIYTSDNSGITWTQRVDYQQWGQWGNLFVDNDILYWLATNGVYEDIVIRKSVNGGRTWSSQSVLLTNAADTNYLSIPTPIITLDGYVITALQNRFPDEWPEGSKPFLMFAASGADLTNAGNWTTSNELAYNQAWTPAGWGTPGDGMGWMEGNPVVDSSGDLKLICRVNSEPVANKGAVIDVAWDSGVPSATLSFDSDDDNEDGTANGFIDLPGGMSKFHILKDVALYLMLSNPVTGSNADQRNILKLFSATDPAGTWTECHTVVQDDRRAGAVSEYWTGFQYPSFIIDGSDLVTVLRTAYRFPASRVAYTGSYPYHDANRITFHRVTNYAQYL